MYVFNKPNLGAFPFCNLLLSDTLVEPNCGMFGMRQMTTAESSIAKSFF